MLMRFTLTMALLLIGGCLAAHSAPLPLAPDAGPPVVLAAGGCGPAFHPDPFGVCVPNRRVIYRLPPPCPRGYHRDPDPARPICYPNL